MTDIKLTTLDELRELIGNMYRDDGFRVCLLKEAVDQTITERSTINRTIKDEGKITYYERDSHAVALLKQASVLPILLPDAMTRGVAITYLPCMKYDFMVMDHLSWGMCKEATLRVYYTKKDAGVEYIAHGYSFTLVLEEPLDIVRFTIEQFSNSTIGLGVKIDWSNHAAPQPSA